MGKIITCKYCGVTKEVRQHAETCGSGICRMRKHREAREAGKTLVELIAGPTLEELSRDYKAALDAYHDAKEEADACQRWVEEALSEIGNKCAELGFAVKHLEPDEPRITLTEAARLQKLHEKYGKKE